MRSTTMSADRNWLGIFFSLRGQGFGSQLVASLKVHFFLFILVAAYLAGLAFAIHLVVQPVELTFMGLMTKFIGLVPTTLLGVVILRFMHMVYYVRPEHPIAHLAKDSWQFLSDRTRLLNALPVTFALVLVIYCFAIIKNIIPVINPYSWDLSLMELDRLLHFGVDPWRILHPILGYWPITFVINIIYNLWFVVIWVVWIALAFATKQSELRLQYLTTYFLVWTIGGSLLAIVFSSVGPAYYGHIVEGTDPYAPLMNYLREVHAFIPLWAIQTQDMLWQAYINNKDSFGSGISAMPSMHNTTAFIIALLGWRVNRAAGIAGSLFALFIFLGSIHLGWHYAVDAYLGFAIAGFCWWISGHFARWYMAQPYVQRNLSKQQEA